MSTADDSGQEPEQQTQPVAEAGGEGKVDRSVQGTDLRSGLAEWLQEVEGALEDGAKRPLTQFEIVCVAVLRDNRDRLRRILDANNAST
jgi:gluconate kinase